MTFAIPWIFALGIIAAAAPAIIHWLTHPRPVRMPLSTLRFVREAIRQRRATHRLRDWLILALRTLAILLLAAAFAGPQWGERSLMDEDAGDAVRVVVLDVSQSMAAADGNTPAIERARSIADRYLQFRPGLRSNLVLAGAKPQAVFDNPSTNFEALREELSRAKALPQRADVKGALEMAARLLAPADENDRRRRELVIISDFQRSGWARRRSMVFRLIRRSKWNQLHRPSRRRTWPSSAPRAGRLARGKIDCYWKSSSATSVPQAAR